MNELTNYINKILSGWENSILKYLPNIFLAIITLIAFIFFAKLARHISLSFYRRATKKHADIANIIVTGIYFFFLLSGVFLALQVAGLEQMLTHVLAGAGIVGIVAGFAFKDIASNIFAGLLLKIQNPFKEGDWVTIDNTYGSIINVGWITTVIKTVPGQEVFVPNQIIYSSTFTNYSTWGKTRVILKSGVSYGDDLEHVKSVTLDEVNKLKSLLSDEGVEFYYTDIGGSTFNFMLLFWIKFETDKDLCQATSDIIIQIKKRFETENISIAYPVTSLDFGVKGGVNLFDKAIQINSQDKSINEPVKPAV